MGKQLLPVKNKFAVFIKIVWCRCVASAAVQPRRLVAAGEISPPERSNPLNGENLILQVRELRRNPLRSCAVPVGSRTFGARPLAVGTADGRKNMRASRPHTPRQVRVTCTTVNKFAVFIKIAWCRCFASAAIQLRKLVVHSTKSPRRSGPIHSMART